MGDHEQELKIREENGDPLAAVVPRIRLRAESGFSGNVISAYTVDLFYFIPCDEYFSISAQGFGQIRGSEIENETRCYSSMINHIFLQANAIGGGTKGAVPVQYPTWTVVPSAHDPLGYAGYLYRVVYTVKPEDVMKEIDMHLKSCTTKASTAKMNGSKNYSQRPFSQRFTYTEWAFMCDWYLSRTTGYEKRAQGLSGVNEPDNVYYPVHVFSVDTALKKMKAAGATPDFCDRSSFLDNNGNIAFPEGGRRTFLVYPDNMDVQSINKTYLPHVPRAINYENEEFRAFARGAGYVGEPVIPAKRKKPASVSDGLAGMLIDDEKSQDGVAVPDEDSEADQEINLDVVMKAFNELTATGEPESSNTLLGWKERVRKRMSRARKEAANDPRNKAILRREAQKECIHWFFTDVFTTDETADAGDSLRALAGWYKDFLRKNANFCMPNEKYTKNLSRFGDTQAQEAALGDTVWAIHVAHQEVASLRLASLHVYFYSPFHVHTCLLGGPGSGKSNAFQINNKRLIPGTTRDIGVESGKAKMTPGKKTDLSIETYEDISPSQVGVSNQVKSANGKAATTSNTDSESMLKYRLTKGRMKGVYKAVINGVHTMVEVDSFCNTVMLIGMNAILPEIPKSISNRFNNIQFQTRTRLDSNGEEQNTSSKFAHGHNPTIQPVQASSIRRDQRNQVFHAIIQLLIWGGVFILNMAVGWLIWSKVLAKAKTKGLQETGEIRHYERLQMHGETLVVADAIGRVMDAGGDFSPLKVGEKFKLDDIIEFEKHLYCNTEHAAFALGLLQHQWENPTIHAVEKFFKDVLFSSHIQAARRLGNLPPPPPIGGAKTNLEPHYYITRIDGLPVHSGIVDQQRLTANIQRLQRHASRSMMPCPQENEVTYALECLSQLQVQVQDIDTDKMIQIPVLQFTSDGDVMVAKEHMRNYTTNRMQQCLHDVLSHRFTKPKNFLYGRTKEKNPNIYQTMLIRPDPTKKLVMEQSSFFSAAVLKMTHNAVKGVSASAYERRAEELQEDEAGEEHFNGLFSDSPHKDVDMDLDDWASQSQCQKIGLNFFPPTNDAPGYDTTPDAIMQATIQRMGNEFSELATYPYCFKELRPSTYKRDILLDKKAHPEKYSLRATVGAPVPAGSKRKRVVRVEEEEQDENQENNPPAAAAAADEEDDEAEEPHACNAQHFCDDGEEEEENNDVEDEDRTGEGVIPPPDMLLHGGPGGGPLPEAWNGMLHPGSEFNLDDWQNILDNAQAVSEAGIYQALPSGVAPANRVAAAGYKKARFSENADE
jgi:hypothetical protein